MANTGEMGSASQGSTEQPLVANLQIISPSVGVASPLRFEQVPASTTIGGVKQMIKEKVSSRPANDQQRLIYSGRLLPRDSDTLLQFFGEERLRNPDNLVIHLIIKEPLDSRSGANSLPHSRASSPAPGMTGRAANYDVPPMMAHHRAPRSVPPQHTPAATPPMPHMLPNVPAIPHALLQQHLQQHIAQGQQARAAMGMHGIQDAASRPMVPNGVQIGPEMQTTGHLMPDGTQQSTTHHSVHEGMRNGQLWRMTISETVVNHPNQAQASNGQPLQMPAPQPGSPFTAADVQNILRSADYTNAAAQMMQRSTSGASHASMPHGVRRSPSRVHAVPLGANGAAASPVGGSDGAAHPVSSRPATRTATPDPQRQSASAPPAAGVATGSARPASGQQPVQPEVYILSSPTGPRALLLNDSHDLYYTPNSRPYLPVQAGLPPLAMEPRAFQAPARPFIPLNPQPQVTPHISPMARPTQMPTQANGNATGQQDLANNVAARAPRPAAVAAPAPAQAQAPAQRAEDRQFAVNILQHMWLLIRLGAFVWWITSSDTSWSRWLTLVTLATLVFVLNTGMLNPAGNAVYEVVRQHLQGLIPPIAAPNTPANRPGQAAPATAANAAQPAPPTPAQIAERLVAQHRDQNGAWLMTQVRRVERAALLFVASIAPGVAEGHIARLEEHERQERARREAAEQQAREAAAAAAASANVQENTGVNAQQQGAETLERTPRLGETGEAAAHDQ